MIMVSAEIRAGRKLGRDEQATDRLLEEFIAKLPQVHLETLRYES